MFDELIERKFRIDLFEKDKNPRWSFSKLKYQYEYPQICRIIDSLPENSLYNSWIYGKTLPNNVGNIANAEIIYNGDNIEDEINWTLLSIRKYADEINQFVKLKKCYDIALLNGEYDLAENILDEIDRTISTSLWSIENRFLIIELKKGLKENTNFLNEINNQNEKGFILCLAHFFSLKAEKELSVNRYEVSLFKFILPFIQKGYKKDFEYYLFKLHPFFQIDYSHLSAIIAFENYNSIIDRYLTLIKVLRLIIANTSAENKDLRNFISGRILYLKRKVDDPVIKKLCVLLDIQNADLEISMEDINYMKALESYAKGNYKDAELKAEELIKSNPLIIEAYDIYVKSRILLNKPIEISSKPSFKESIIASLYNLYNKETDPAESDIILRKIAFNISSIDNVSYYLIDVIKKEVENDFSFDILSRCYSSCINPRMIITEEKSKQLDTFYNAFPFSDTIKLELKTLNNEIFFFDKESVSDFYYLFNKGLYLQMHENFKEAISIWSNLLEKHQIQSFQIEQTLINLFYCQAKLKELDSCIHLFVEYYFKNKFLTQRLNVNIVKEQIKKEKYRKISHSIELPLFFYLTNSDDYDIHTAYECFLLSTDSEKPSELINKTKFYDEYLIFFLKNICTVEIFKHSPFITNTNNKLNERIVICQTLKNIDSQNKLEYIDEENMLSRKLIIQKGLQEIDESKIYVNQTSIMQNELKDLKSVFNRYISIGELSSEKKISVINFGSEKMFNFSIQEHDSSNSEFSKDPQYDIFKEMFFDIRDKFLFSKYGLKLYLSARIRHGVLLGEIRPEFELLHLVTEKEKGLDSYKPNRYWEQLIKSIYGETLFNKFNKHLAEFSKEIDEIINKELLDKYILIRTEKENHEGWLNYEFAEVDLQLLYSLKFKDILDYQMFINMIFEEMWIRTSLNLNTVKEKIQVEIKEMFFTTIQKLEKESRDLGINITELYEKLTDVKVKIDNKLNKIARWFTITDTQISNFEFNKIMEVCCESLHNHYTSKELKLNKNIKFTSLIKGEFYTHFVDLLRIFFQNILDYSTKEEVEASIAVEELEEHIFIKIENSLKEEEDINELSKKVNIDNDIHKSMLDKKSGLYKALNIVKTNFDNESNELNITIDNNKFSVSVLIYKNNILV